MLYMHELLAAKSPSSHEHSCDSTSSLVTVWHCQLKRSTVFDEKAWKLVTVCIHLSTPTPQCYPPPTALVPPHLAPSPRHHTHTHTHLCLLQAKRWTPFGVPLLLDATLTHGSKETLLHAVCSHVKSGGCLVDRECMVLCVRVHISVSVYLLKKVHM